MEKIKKEEEIVLETSPLFCQKVEVSYQSVEHPRCQLADASPSREKVLENVITHVAFNE
uniref:Uncharacterized protein n=1 Tax=Ornithorhynchus anatinus TaxID=9258 RepID=A0A6I8PHI8_ORNAN